MPRRTNWYGGGAPRKRTLRTRERGTGISARRLRSCSPSSRRRKNPRASPKGHLQIPNPFNDLPIQLKMIEVRWRRQRPAIEVVADLIGMVGRPGLEDLAVGRRTHRDK